MTARLGCVLILALVSALLATHQAAARALVGTTASSVRYAPAGTVPPPPPRPAAPAQPVALANPWVLLLLALLLGGAAAFRLRLRRIGR